MSESQVATLIEQVPSDSRPRDATQVATFLNERKLLTPFQATRVAENKAATLVLGEYIVLDELGGGGMGQVFKAKHRRMDRLVAIKLISPLAMKDEMAIKRFQREVRAAAKLEHPNIVAAYDAGEYNGLHFLVMQFIDGSDLSQVVKKQGPLPVGQAVNCILQAARGLAYAHSEGLVHRDIKPANLILDKKGVVKVLDMGLARIDENSMSDGLTTGEQVMGTVDYMSPEQGASTHDADHRSDIYSLGCTLWYLLTGGKVYEGDTAIKRIMQHNTAPIPSLMQRRDDVPWAVEQVFRRMVAKKPEDRYQSMDDVVQELEKVAGGTGGSGSSITQNDQELSKFFQTMGGHVVSQTRVQPATSVTAQAAVLAPSTDSTTDTFRAEVETDPNSQSVIPKPTAQSQSNPERKRLRQSPMKMIGLATLGSVLIFAGITVLIVRNREGKEVGRIEIPEGGTFAVETKPTSPPPVPKNAPAATPAPATAKAVPKKAADPQRDLAEWVINSGGSVSVDRDAKTIQQLDDLPKEAFTIGSINASKIHIGREEVKRFSAATTLVGLSLYHCHISADGVDELSSLKALRRLLFSSCTFDKDAWQPIPSLTRLSELGFTICTVPDDFLGQLAGMKRLIGLRLFSCKSVTKVGFEKLASSPPPKLRSLDLTETAIDGGVLNAFSRLPHLNTLSLSKTPCDDEIIQQLASAQALSAIGLSQTKVTREGVEWLHANLNYPRIGFGKGPVPSLNGPTYLAAIKGLVMKGWSFDLRLGDDTKVVSVSSKVAWPLETESVTVNRASYQKSTSSDSFEELAQLRDLQFLSTEAGASLPAGAVKALLPLSNLSSISLGDALATADDVALLPQFKKLQAVSICADGDEMIGAIAKLPHLSTLSIMLKSNVTTGALKHLESAATLNELRIGSNVPIPLAAVEQFASTRPDVDVYREGKLIEPPETMSVKVSASTSPGTNVAPTLSPYDLLTSPKYEWSQPQELELNQAEGLFITNDGLTAYSHNFVELAGSKLRSQLRVRYRESLDHPFGPYGPLGPDASVWKGGFPCVTDDGLLLFFAGPGPTEQDNTDIWSARRDTRATPWQPPVRLGPEVNSTEARLEGPFSADGLTLYFNDGNTIYETRRSSRDSAFGSARKTPGLPTGGSNGNPAVSADGKVIIFARSGVLWQASRSSIDEDFKDAKPLTTNSGELRGSDPNLMPDGQTLYFKSQSKGWLSRRVLKTVTAPGR